MPAAPTNTYQCDLPRQTRTTVLGTYKNGILLYTPKDGRITRIGDKGSEFLDICSFSEDINGKIWIGTNGNLFLF